MDEILQAKNIEWLMDTKTRPSIYAAYKILDLETHTN